MKITKQLKKLLKQDIITAKQWDSYLNHINKLFDNVYKQTGEYESDPDLNAEFDMIEGDGDFGRFNNEHDLYSERGIKYEIMDYTLQWMRNDVEQWIGDFIDWDSLIEYRKSLAYDSIDIMGKTFYYWGDKAR